MRMYDVIYKKRKGGELTEEEIRSFISGYVAGEIPDYQASALLMAICFSGMNEAETAILTDAVANSGDTVDLSRFGTLTADSYIDAISADDNKIVQFGVRINPDEGGVNGNLYWQTDMHPGYSEPQNQSFRYANTTDV